jgi:hypothetical protein
MYFSAVPLHTGLTSGRTHHDTDRLFVILMLNNVALLHNDLLVNAS